MTRCPRLFPSALRSQARRLADDTGGLALIEFALSLPILVTLLLCGLETANLAIANLRVSQIAMLTADNAARVRDPLEESDLNEVLYGAKSTGSGFDFANRGRIILSDLELNAAGNGQYIRWQRCTGAKVISSAYGVEGRGKTDTTLQYMGPSTSQIAATAGNPVMFVEVYYDYKPLVSSTIFGARVITFRSAFNVRQRTGVTPGNTDGVTKSLCTTYSA